MKKDKNKHWSFIIQPKTNLFETNFREIIKYRDLIKMFVKRDFVTFYKQTILGTVWYVIQPIVNTIVFTFIFGKIAKIPSDGIPHFIFYLCGTVTWTYFANCINSTSNTFVNNAQLFSKVYFPRITLPIASVISNLIQLLIQLLIFVFFYFYYLKMGANFTPTANILFLPLVIIQMAILGLGFGILISSLTSKYRDLTFVMTFFVQIWMFATPIVYPLSAVPEKYKLLYSLNPMTSVVEIFREAFFGVSSIEPYQIFVSLFITLFILFFGLIFFNKIEKTFIDTV